MIEGVTITRKQFNKYSKEGKKLLDENLTSGFQIEDFNPRESRKAKLVYGHDNPQHIKVIQKQVGGKVYPRVSLYKWDATWKPGQNTRLLYNKSIAYERGRYLETSNVRKAKEYTRTNTYNKLSKNPLAYSWDVPDVRVSGSGKARHYKKAWLVTQNIDRDSRFATLVTRKNKLKRIRKELVGERVRPVLLQNYHPSRDDSKSSSFWYFIHKTTK